MNTTRMGMIVLLATLAYSAQSARAQFSCDKTMTQTGDWSDDTKWDPSAPGSGDNACINSGVVATVKTGDSDAACKDLKIISTGKIIVESPRKLVIHGNATSEIDGVIELNRGTTLDFQGCPTMEGNGGRITGLSSSTGNAAIISGTGADILFTGSTTRATSLVVKGFLDLQVTLTNDAYVVANDGVLKLTSANKDGSGMWIAEYGGTLSVEKQVSGTGGWELITGSTSVIHFKTVDNINMDGDFVIEDGTLKVDMDVTTTGDLTFESVSGSNPRIEVADTKKAIFNETP